MKPLFVACVAALAVWWSASPARAAFLVTNSGYVEGSSVIFNQSGLGQFDQPVGYRFTVGANDLKVTALGDWDSRADGLPSPILVVLWDTSTSAALANVTVPAGTAGTLGATDYRFVTLTSPVTLLAGHSYTIADRRTPAGGIQTQEDLSSGPAAFSPDITFNGTYNTSPAVDFNSPLSSQMPTQLISQSPAWVGPNFIYTVSPNVTAAPAPSSLALFASAVLPGLGYFGWRRRKAVV